MKTGEVETLFQYNYWANGKIVKYAGLAGEARFTEPAAVSFGSLRGTLVHIYWAEWLWRVRCQVGISPQEHAAETDFPDLQTLGRRWLAEEQAMLDYLSALQDEDLDRIVAYRDTRGVDHENPLWQLLLHVVNHGTQFRSEAAVILTQAGHSPGDLDFIAFLREPRG